MVMSAPTPAGRSAPAPNHTEDAGMAEVIFAKNRAGSTGTARLKFVAEWTKFMSIQGDF